MKKSVTRKSMTTAKVRARGRSLAPDALREGRSAGMMLVIDRLREMGKSLSWLAEQLGRSRQLVSAWDDVPDDVLPEVSAYTGLPREKIRPDIFRTVKVPKSVLQPAE